jgi:predicted nucleic acid-binding protein
MRVVDTSAWIEGIVLGASGIVTRLPSREDWIVPTIVQMELAKWLNREAEAAFTEAVLAYTSKCVVVDLTSLIALSAAEYTRLYKLPTADAIIYATAVETSSDLLTCDAHFENLPQVVYVPKIKA